MRCTPLMRSSPPCKGQWTTVTEIRPSGFFFKFHPVLLIISMAPCLEVTQNHCSFVSLIDREGRSLVKCSSYQSCNEVKSGWGDIVLLEQFHGTKKTCSSRKTGHPRMRKRYSTNCFWQVRRVVERITGRRGSKPLKVTFSLSSCLNLVLIQRPQAEDKVAMYSSCISLVVVFGAHTLLAYLASLHIPSQPL